MTAAPAPTRTPPRWLPLDDHPAALCPLELGIVRLSVHGRVRTLLRALNLTDPDGLSTRLLAQREGRLFLHAAHLETLTAPLGREQALAFQLALGVTPEPDVPAAPPPRPRPDFLHQAALGPRAAVPAVPVGETRATPATRLARAMHRLGDDPDALSTYNAVLATEALRAVAWHWLDQRGALHLELLCGVDAGSGPGGEVAGAALQQLQTTLTGARRGAARALVEAARAQHAALRAHQSATRLARRELIRAAVQGAALLTRAGWLNRPADARWLTPAELRDALDGTLDPGTLRGLTQLRRLQHTPAADTPTWTLVDRQYPAVPLSPGVRDGQLYAWTPGQTVPDGVIALCSDVRPWHRPQLSGAAAVVLDHAGPLSAPALHERGLGRPAVGLRGRRPEWLQDGAVVRVNAHQGTVTLLRRAPDPAVPTPGIVTAREETVALVPSGQATHAAPRGIAGLSLDFDFS
ncbi:phosphohistidine swiveling domain-containing protein [Deinococcus metalli]|uniref:Phosphohistidine swiveling domain-containing protein n=1 Tax=Deinococcus metalli TaxID=1141878 RepID=A0A7W8NM90_9DEIO|nr:hypothetical protein [Deinococcus metalli]MBB5375544.1 phosphohistidine swiveling domain-containing protein [Deinococcus metalli]GHF28477.1 hypothetical protein GCM10017781_00520 [Deinococcus metalli]